MRSAALSRRPAFWHFGSDVPRTSRLSTVLVFGGRNVVESTHAVGWQTRAQSKGRCVLLNTRSDGVFA
eukprot:3566526-Pyramimonas_sp.AAC.1